MSFEKEEHLFFRNFWFLYFQKLHFWKYMYLYKVGVCRSKYTLSSTAHIPLYDIHYTVSPCLVQLCIVRNFFKPHYLFKSYFTESYLNYFQMVAGVVNWNSISIWLLLFVDISQLFFSFGPLNYFSSAYFELTLLTCPVCFFYTFLETTESLNLEYLGNLCLI